MKYIVNILFVIVSIFSNAQNLVSYKISECDSDSYVELVRRRIVSKIIQNDTLALRLGFIGNCCFDLKPRIWGSKDSLFLSMENMSDIYCSCDCCFEMDVKVSGISDTNFVIIWDKSEVKRQSKYPLLPHEYYIDEETPVNMLNSDGLKIGLWYFEINSSGRKYEWYYDLNPDEVEILLWSRVYNKDGELEEVGIKQEGLNELLLFEPGTYYRAFEK